MDQRNLLREQTLTHRALSDQRSDLVTASGQSAYPTDLFEVISRDIGLAYYLLNSGRMIVRVGSSRLAMATPR
jgi:hypothetical protein